MTVLKFDISTCIALLLILTASISTPFVFPSFIERWYQMLSVLMICFTSVLVLRYYKVHASFFLKLFLFLLFYDTIRCTLIFILYNSISGFEFLLYGIGLMFKYILYISICIFVKNKYKVFLDTFFSILLFIAALSFPLFLLILCYGVDFPHLERDTGDLLNACIQRLYFIGGSNAVHTIAGFDIIRVAGFCDEPGAFALLLTNLLILNELTYKNKDYRYIILIAGLLTFSMAFFITLFPILIYWYIKKEKSPLILLLLTLLIIVIFISSNEAMYSILDRLIFERFTYNDTEGIISGENRYIYSEIQKEIFFNYPWFGAMACQSDIDLYYYLSAPTIYSFFAQHGVFIIISQAPFIYVCFLYRKRIEFLLFTALILNFFQRPGFSMIHVVFIILYYYVYVNEYQSIKKQSVSEI